jgi:hypothetical protein
VIGQDFVSAHSPADLALVPGTLASLAGVHENGRSVLDEEAPWALRVLARVELGGAAF